MKSHTNSPRPWMTPDTRDQAPEPTPERADESDLVKIGGSRRSFLKALGLSGVVTASACERQAVKHAVPLLIPTEEVIPGVPIRYASTCAGCSASCGLLVTVRDGRPVKLEGRPSHPLSRGGLCAVGQGHLRGLYDAGRLRAPLLNKAATTWSAVDAHVQAGLSAARDANKSVYILAPSIVSPTDRGILTEFLKVYGGKLVEYDAGPGYASATLAAYEQLDGRARLPALAIDKSDLLVTIGADLLGSGHDPVAHTAQYADRRRRRESGDDFVHVHIEGTLTLTGAASDERILATSSERRAIVLSLLGAVAKKATGALADRVRPMVGATPGPEAHASRIALLASTLWGRRGHSLIVSGANNVGEQLAVALLNRLLGNEPLTLDPARESWVARGRDGAVSELLTELKGGRVGALFVLGQNPVEELPSGDELAALIGSVGLSVALTDRPTATAGACQVVAAAHHALERWGDASPARDVLTIAQPTIRPMFDTRHPVGCFLKWGSSDEADYLTHLKSAWKDRVHPHAPGTRFHAFWTRAVSAGEASTRTAIMSNPPTPVGAGAVTNDGIKPLLAGLGSNDELEGELLAEVGLRDGKNSFNPWLRELPEPLTRTAWVATVRIAPALAKQKGIRDGDEVEITAGDTKLRMPARIQPGQHPSVLGVPVGYGLKDGDGAEQARNGYRLSSWRSGQRAQSMAGVTIRKTGPRTELPLMQVHSSSEGRPIIHQVSAPGEKVDAGHHGPAHSLWKKREYKPHWQMSINLDACTGCSACVVACQAENNIPVVGPEHMQQHRDMHWLRIDRYFSGSVDDPEVLFEPMMCSQCDNAPCETVCPVAATVHSHDGLNHQAYNRCVGTRYCANNCPYKVRRFNWIDYTAKDPIERMVLNPDVVVRERGIMEKCTFCVQRIQLARIDAKNSGAPIEVETACQQSCPAKAITFGDATVKDGEINQMKHKPRAFQVLADLGVEPSITYLARIRRRDGEGGES